MPCNAVVYLPATIRQLDTTAMFANSATHTLAAKMLEATLTALLNNDNIGAYDYATNITIESCYGTIRIWQDGRVTIRLYPDVRDPEGVTATIWEAITATLASLTQLLTAQAIGAVIQVTDTAFVGNNMVLTVNI
jgi:uncharacterized protein YqiB (DUF1249 family)